MKIAVFYDILSGGAKRSVYEFVKHLKALGHLIDLYAPERDHPFMLANEYVERRYDFKFTPLLDLGSQTLLFSPLFLLEIIKLRAFSIRLARDMNVGKYDLIFAHNSRYTQCPLLLRYLKSPTIYYCHEPLRFVTEPHPSFRGVREDLRGLAVFLTRPIQRLIFHLESFNLKKADLILTNSFFTMENLYRLYGTYSIPCYQGVDTERFKPYGKKRENFVLSVGQLNRWKGQDFLIRSLALVPHGIRPALHLVYNKCAEGFKSYLDRKAADLGIHIKYFENIQESELVEMYNRAMFLVYSPIMEPFGFAPLEAMACETPVVAIQEGGVRETVVHGENGLLTPRDLGEFSKAMIQLLLSQDLRKKLGKQGRRYVEHQWSWFDSAKRLESYMFRLKNRERFFENRN